MSERIPTSPSDFARRAEMLAVRITTDADFREACSREAVHLSVPRGEDRCISGLTTSIHELLKIAGDLPVGIRAHVGQALWKLKAALTLELHLQGKGAGHTQADNGGGMASERRLYWLDE